MAFSETFVQYINDSLKAGSLNSKKFQPGAFHGIVSLVARKGLNDSLQLLPAIAHMDGNFKAVEPNDKFNVIIYHKVIANSYLYQKQDSFGDHYVIKSTNEMAMIVWVNTKKAKLTAEQIEALFIAGLPQDLSPEKKKEIGIYSCKITPVATDMDKLRVFRQEYQNIPFFLRPEHCFFQLRYKAELTFDQACLLNCGCGSE